MSLDLELERPAPTRLLVIDDAEVDSTLLQIALQDRFLATVWIDDASTLESGLHGFERDTFDGVVRSVGHPDDQSPRVLARVL